MYCKNCGQKIEEGHLFCKHCGTATAKAAVSKRDIGTWFKKHKKGILIGCGILVVVVIVLVVIVIFSGSNDSTKDNSPSSSINSSISVQNAVSEAITAFNSALKGSSVDQDAISSYVVNILCTDSSGNQQGGSGTIITSDGLVLTNAHIIPVDSNGNPSSGDCVVTLPDSQGKVKSIYSATPIIVPSLSQQDDIAFLDIDGPYTNDIGITQGQWPTTFPDFGDDGCVNFNPTLGEKITVFGYPQISANGNYLTITSGQVSSLPDDGTIITSAKVDHGSSGGLAVDENGCMLGIPTAISGQDNESLGVITSDNIIANFLNKASSTSTNNGSSN
ncbi:MAG TPA: trypsin-like peptidase domain-containing protein [Candidatus Nanoarchaeia archaeon]|nr:trypsin-like peptidase domain-containing protein [Candidatus Nanoarchaeia archaeon]